MQGVMLTHANLLAVVAGQLGAINQVGGRYGQKFTQDDVMISYLPLAHIFDRWGMWLHDLPLMREHVICTQVARKSEHVLSRE
jgi:long-subunit acyl-CoA synthetase (AMP-forming)